MSQVGSIRTYASGVDVVFEWRIENFFTLESGVYCCSPKFSFGGEKWRLRIYPYGNDSSGHVDLSLYKRLSDRTIKQSFFLFLKTAKGEKYNEQHFTKDFAYHGAHDLKRFIPKSELSRRKSDLAPDGTLTVICTMKSSTSAGSDSNVASSSVDRCHCKGTFGADSMSSHQKICMHRPVKCPDCLEVVVLQKWFYEHECQQERREVGKYPEHPFVEVPTQSVDASTQTVEASIETVEEKCEDCASGSSIGFQDDELRHDFKELFLKKEDCDIIIKVKDSEFPAHRVILKARSPVFASTFRHDMKENTTGVLEIQDCDSSTFSDFLCFLYCGDVGIISQENVFGLFTAADKYQVLKLRAKCLEFMKMNITVDTFCETLTLALRHSETELIKLCTDYFKKNIRKLL